MVRVVPSFVALAWTCVVPAQLWAQDQQAGEEVTHHEVPDDAYKPGTAGQGSSPATVVQVGPYVSRQVNVNGSGDNIVGDAANEPSIAVDPTDPMNLVVGWRQFDTISSNFRQAGWAYSHDGGVTWTFPGRIEAGLFRSDPVLSVGSDGTFYYFSLDGNFACDVFTSTDKGVTWPIKTPAFGGDKNWMTIDVSGGIGDGNLYGIWQRFFNCCNEDTLTRSTDGAGSFETPVEIPESPTFGIVDVGPDGTLYAAGIQANDRVGQNFNQFVVAHSDNAQDPAQSPTFTTEFIDLGGRMEIGENPNPAGLLGQAYVRADPSNPDRVFALASTNPSGSDPMDVFITRSDDGGDTWYSPMRVNSDDQGSGRWQWFGTMDVAPDGRVDVVWLDNRASGTDRLHELYYAWSYDSGETWLGEIAVSPQFDSHLGWPQQNKMGDYYDMVSNEAATDLIYAATFNGEQDVYHVSLFPDCNDNGTPDFEDIQSGASQDVDGDRLPDDCEAFTLEASPLNPNLLDDVRFSFDNGKPGSLAFLYLFSVNGVPFTFNLGRTTFDAEGKSELVARIPNNGALSGLSFTFASLGFFLDDSLAISDEVTIVIQ